LELIDRNSKNIFEKKYPDHKSLGGRKGERKREGRRIIINLE